VSFNFRIIIFVDTLCTHLLFILEVNFNFQENHYVKGAGRSIDGGDGILSQVFNSLTSLKVDVAIDIGNCCANYNYSQVHESFCNIVLCKCEVDPTGN
jgi:hypothetical protein